MKKLLILIITCTCVQLYAQNSFQNEVDTIVMQNDSIWDSSRKTTLFTGSSSIRLWNDVQKRFPKYQVLNTGFGGSQTSDLLYHLNDLVLNYQPSKIFIYEGDNDIFAKKRPRQIIKTTNEVITEIQNTLPQSEIILISAKPSIARWKFRGRYKRLNKLFAKLASENDAVFYVDVWNTMLNGKKVRADIFIEDGLHMNALGYELWYEKIKAFLP